MIVKALTAAAATSAPSLPRAPRRNSQKSSGSSQAPIAQWWPTVTWETKVTLHWSGTFAQPDLLAFDVDYVWHGLPGETADDPWFLVLTLTGDVRDVIRALLPVGSDQEFSFTSEPDEQWTVVADEQTATLYLNGREFAVIPLD